VDLGLTPARPPDVLFHGTVDRLPAIPVQGLVKGKRHQVHLSATREVAFEVVRRRGEPRVLEVDASGMALAGCAFYRSDNGVWPTDRVPQRFLRDGSNLVENCRARL